MAFKRPLQVLVVEDDESDARVLQQMFAKEKEGSFEITHLLCMSDALNHLAKGGTDIILLDMGLPDGHGLDIVRRAHALAPGVPVIILTGLDDEALAVDAIKEGAQDYLIKGQIESRALPRALRHAIERHRLQAETDLIRTNQLQFKDNFLSHVSHELRSPLNAIYQFVTILLDNLVGELNAEQRDYLKIVFRNAKQLQAMIEDLLEVTRGQGGKLTIELQRTSVRDAIDDAINTLQVAAAGKKIKVTVHITEELPLVCADPTRVRQILIILLDNAIKFTPPNGSVMVQARLFEKDSNLLVLEVSDTGCGITPGMTERIFERLFQASDPSLAGRQGLGLGLYICKELVWRQGGRIWATSAPGKGSVFSVTLPVFCMRNLISGTLEQPEAKPGPLTLLVAQMQAPAGWASDQARAEHSLWARQLLHRCLHDEGDTLLPKMGSSGQAELFFVLATTDAEGGELMTTRIRDQFDERESQQKTGLELSISCRSVRKARNGGAGLRKNASFEAVAAVVQALVNEELSSRMVANG